MLPTPMSSAPALSAWATGANAPSGAENVTFAPVASTAFSIEPSALPSASGSK